MTDTKQIKDHMEVVGSCGTHLGTVDRVEGNSILLTKNDVKAGGLHHLIPLDWVASVDDKVHLNKDCDAALRDWQDAPLSTNV